MTDPSNIDSYEALPQQHVDVDVDMDDGVLIELVAQYPILYDMQLRDYKNNVLKESTWEFIGSIMQHPGIECMKRWSCLRDSFRREKKRDLETRSGSGLAKRKGFAMYNHMRFLDCHIKRRRCYTNAPRTNTSNFALTIPPSHNAFTLGSITEGLKAPTSPSMEPLLPIITPVVSSSDLTSSLDYNTSFIFGNESAQLLNMTYLTQPAAAVASSKNIATQQSTRAAAPPSSSHTYRATLISSSIPSTALVNATASTTSNITLDQHSNQSKFKLPLTIPTSFLTTQTPPLSAPTTPSSLTASTLPLTTPTPPPTTPTPPLNTPTPPLTTPTPPPTTPTPPLTTPTSPPTTPISPFSTSYFSQALRALAPSASTLGYQSFLPPSPSISTCSSSAPMSPKNFSYSYTDMSSPLSDFHNYDSVHSVCADAKIKPTKSTVIKKDSSISRQFAPYTLPRQERITSSLLNNSIKNLSQPEKLTEPKACYNKDFIRSKKLDPIEASFINLSSTIQNRLQNSREIEKENCNPDQIFGNFVSAELGRMPENRKSKIKCKIMQILCDDE